MDNNKKTKSEYAVKYQIFVSSPFKDLVEARKIAIQSIIQTGNFPIALEGVSPKDQTDRDVIENTIKDCDIYLIIMGSRYGELMKSPNSK